MKRFARVPIIPGTVMEVYDGEELFPMHPETASTWLECPATVTQHYYYDGTHWLTPVEKAREDAGHAAA